MKCGCVNRMCIIGSLFVYVCRLKRTEKKSSDPSFISTVMVCIISGTDYQAMVNLRLSERSHAIIILVPRCWSLVTINRYQPAFYMAFYMAGPIDCTVIYVKSTTSSFSLLVFHTVLSTILFHTGF